MTDFIKLDRFLDKVGKVLSISTIRPTNLLEEKKKFFASNDYNPQFKYKTYDKNYDLLKQKLEAIQLDAKTPLGMLYQAKINEIITKINLIKNRGKLDYGKASIELYGKPGPKVLSYAKKVLRTKLPKEKEVHSSEKIALFLRTQLERHGFNWTVQHKNLLARAEVCPSSRTINVKKGTMFTRNYIKRLVVHEIGTHVVRYENGCAQPLKLLANGTAGYLATEEGLAVLNEELNQCLDLPTLKKYAARVLAVDKAIRCSFRETFTFLRQYFSNEEAWEITMRSKRGCGNTYWGGAFTKDYLYLDGYLKVKSYLQKGGDLNRLYYGKIGIEDLPLVERIPNLENPFFLSNMHAKERAHYSCLEVYA